MKRAQYIIEADEPGMPLVIRDIGPWDQFQTVTNAAEKVVEELVASGRLPEGRELLYYDSDNSLDEIVVKDRKFVGFKPGIRE